MPDFAFDLRYLRYAILVAEHRSFRRVAALLDLSSSTIGRRIQLLERRLGFPLFERDRHGARLTPAGEKFIRDAEISMNDLDRAILHAKMVHQGQVGEFRVGIVTSLANGLLVELIEEYRDHFPRINVKLEESGWRTTGARVLSGRLDIALLPKGDRLDGCESLPLWKESVVVAVSRDHKFSQYNSVTWEELRDETFLISADVEGSEIERFLTSRFAKFQLRPNISEHTVGRENLLNMAARGFGVFPTLASAVSPGRTDLFFLGISGVTEAIDIHAAWLTGRQSPMLRRFIDLARSKANAAALACRSDRQKSPLDPDVSPRLD